MINSISSMSNYMSGMNTQAMQQRRDDLFNKIDSDSSGGLSKTEFSSFAQKLSEDTGNAVNIDDVYSAYDTNGDGSLSKDELDKFMKDNAPPPPPQGTATDEKQTANKTESSLVNMLSSLSDDDKKSILEVLSDDSKNKDEKELTIANLLKKALESDSYSPVDVFA